MLVHIGLSKEANILIYKLMSINSQGESKNSIVDAHNGEWLQPLNQQNAQSIAKQYMISGSEISESTFIREWLGRKGREPKPAWLITFNDSGKTEIIIDPYTAQILEDQDSKRKFHFWVMRLHQLNFFGTHKILTIIPGGFLLILLFTGIFMYKNILNKKERSEKR